MSRKLLLADDSITIQKVIGITFVNEDFELSVVDNGDAALEKALAERPDLILADVFMPGKNGYELCAAIKAEPSLSRVPVLLLTGTFEPFDEVKAKNVGADGWISKPFESQALVSRVEELLEQAEAEPSISAEPEPLPLAASESDFAAVEADMWEEFGTVPSASSASVESVPDAVSVETEDADFSHIFDSKDEAPATAVGAGQSVEDIWGDISFVDEDLSPESAVETEPDDIWSPREEVAPVSASDPVAAAPSEPTEPELPPQAEALSTAEDALFIFEDDELPEIEAPSGVIEEDLLIFEDDSESVSPAGESAPDEEIMELGEEDILVLDEGDILSADPVMAQVTELEDDFLFVDEEEIEPVEEMSLPQEMLPEVDAPEPEPVIPEPAPVVPAAVQAAAVESRVQALSDAEIEAIVEKVAGAVIERLAGTLLEKIAWEVVPDLAERLIKEEICQIKESVR
jgi:CheY-like chemotaxis protein